MACIYYNADVALQTLVSTQGPRLAGEDGLFNSLLMNLIHMEGPISMRLIVTSFASILAASRETLSMMPPEVTTNLGSMLQQCINELELMRDREWDVGVNEDEDGDGDFDYEDDDGEWHILGRPFSKVLSIAPKNNSSKTLHDPSHQTATSTTTSTSTTTTKRRAAWPRATTTARASLALTRASRRPFGAWPCPRAATGKKRTWRMLRTR